MVEFVKSNWSEILIAIVFFASVIVKLTPTQKDDSILKKIIGFLDNFSVAKTANDKQLIQFAKENAEKATEEESKEESKKETIEN